MSANPGRKHGQSAGAGIIQVSVERAGTTADRWANRARALKTFVESNPGSGMVTESRSVPDPLEFRRLGRAARKRGGS